MKRRHYDFSKSNESGLYQIKIRKFNGDMEIWHNVMPNLYGLTRMVDKCEIKSFEFLWEPREIN